MSLTVAQMNALSGAGISLTQSDTVTVTVGQSDLATVVPNAADSVARGVDALHAQDVTITDAQAAQLVAAGLEFDASSTVAVQADGTHLSTSLKELQTLGVKAVHFTGTDPALIVADLGAGTAGAGGLPAFDPEDHVELQITDTQVAEAAGLASALHTANIDTVVASDHTLDLTGEQLDALVSAGVYFQPEDAVVAHLAAAELAPAIDQTAVFVGQNIQVGLDTIDMTTDAATLTEAQAETLVQAGIDFAPGDFITVQADGTNVSTSLKDIHDLGVDHVAVDATAAAGPGHDVVLELGLAPAAGDPAAQLLTFLENFEGRPAVFDSTADVAIEVTQDLYDAVSTADPVMQDQVVTDLVNLGIDYVKVIGTNIEDDLHNT
jgi:hypothetical protein